MAKQMYAKKYYFPKKLRKELKEVFDYPLTLIQASSGYGKTTAVADCLIKEWGEGFCCHWYVCLGEPAKTAWKGICGLFQSMDNRAACYLQGLILPEPDLLPSIAAQVMKLQCPEPALLIIDNYQLAEFPCPMRLLDALSLHACGNLHILVLTQPLPQERQDFMNPRIKRITADALVFSPADISRMFLAKGIALNQEETGFLWNTTEGLAAALSLQLRHYGDKGAFVHSAQISELMEQAFFNRLNQQEKEFLVMLSVLDSFTIRQAAAILGVEQLPESYERLLKGDFIRRRLPEGCYLFHHLLLTFLRIKFSSWDRDRQNRVLKLAGRNCAGEGDCVGAARLFARAGDYGELLSLPFSAADRFDLVHLDEGGIVEGLITQPVCGLLPEYPELTLSLTLELFIQGRFALHHRYYELVRRILLDEGAGRYEAGRLKRLLGEFSLMESFLAFNDVKAMCERHRQAYALLGSATGLYSLKDAWTFGAPSVVYMFWRETGKLRETLADVTAGMPCYYRLSNGQGTGAPEAMEAEMFLLAGETGQAEGAAARAMAKAERMHQESICFCAELVLARAAILKGSRDGYEHSLSRLCGQVYDGHERRSVLTSEVCQAFLHLMLKQYEEIPSCFFQPEAIRAKTLLPALPFMQIIYGGLMLHRMKQRKLPMAQFERIMITGIQESQALHMLLPAVYNRIYLAVACECSGRRKEALSFLNQALAMALPDQVYLPFAELYESLAPLFDARVCLPSQQEGQSMVIALGRRMKAQVRQLGGGGGRDGKALTRREMEIAILLRQRLEVKEIAERLMISPSTVSNTMRKIYAKLDIHSKRELVDMIF